MAPHLKFTKLYRGCDKHQASPGPAFLNSGERRQLEAADKAEKHEYRSKAWYRARITLPQVSILGDRS